MKRLLALAIVLLLGAAWYVPTRISADRYRDRIHAALEKALGRQVEIGQVRLRLLPTPGLTIADVTIGEDPKIGAEPVAYVTTLLAVPRIGSLFGGPLEFASVDLQKASLNLTRVDRADSDVSWNFAALLRPETLAAFPSVHMRGGRINFKFGDTKSLFYLLNTDVDLWPPDSAQAPWTLRIHAEPARTDRPARARGFGSFLLRGQWLQSKRTATLDVKLEQSELGDILTLFNGAESGIHGDISGDAHLAGPLNRIGIAGRMTVADLHGWNQTPPGGNAWRFGIGGAIDATGQTLDLNARAAGRPSPLAIRYRVADYLRRPRWGVTVNLNRFPLAPVPEIARNLGWPVPPDFKFDGTADGAVGYSMSAAVPRMDGAMNLTNSTFIVAGTPPLHIPVAELHFSGSVILLEATEVTNDIKETAAIAGSWDADGSKLDVQLSSDGMQIAALKRQIFAAGIPLLGNASSGTWKGDLRYRNDVWSGDLNLMNAEIPFEAFSEPMHVVSADATIDGAGLSLKRVNLSIGGIEAQGEYRYEALAPRPHKFRITVSEASGPALEKLLMPTLRRGNFLTYAFNFGRVPQPDWLRNMRADGTIQTDRLDLGGGQFTKLRARVIWEGTDVRLTGLDTRFGDAAEFKGSATIHLAGRQPGYQVAGKLTGLAWRGGTIGADGTMSTSGTGTALLANMQAQGTFDGRNIEVADREVYDSVTGTFDWAWPRLHLPQVVMKSGADTYQGSAELGDNDQLVLKVTDTAKRTQVAVQ